MAKGAGMGWKAYVLELFSHMYDIPLKKNLSISFPILSLIYIYIYNKFKNKIIKLSRMHDQSHKFDGLGHQSRSIQYIFLSIFFLKRFHFENIFKAFCYFELVFMIYFVIISGGLICFKLRFIKLSQFYDLWCMFSKLIYVNSISSHINFF